LEVADFKKLKMKTNLLEPLKEKIQEVNQPLSL